MKLMNHLQLHLKAQHNQPKQNITRHENKPSNKYITFNG